jgi:hypothetical protein
MTALNDSMQRQLRENNTITQEEIALEEGDLLIAENVLSKERRILDRSVIANLNNNSITESKTKAQLLKG